jgi:hypothetical protein
MLEVCFGSSQTKYGKWSAEENQDVIYPRIYDTKMVNGMASQTTSASIVLETVVCKGFYIETALCESIATLSEICSLGSSLSKEPPRVQR